MFLEIYFNYSKVQKDILNLTEGLLLNYAAYVKRFLAVYVTYFPLES